MRRIVAAPHLLDDDDSLVYSVIGQVFAPNAAKIGGYRARRTVAIGMTRLLTEFPPLLADAQHPQWYAPVALYISGSSVTAVCTG